MVQLCGLDIGSSVSEIVQGLSELVLAVCAVVGGVFGWRKWSDEKALKKSKALDELLTKFNNNELRKRVCSMDSSGGASELIRKAMSNAGEVEKLTVEDALMFVALLCQLRSDGVLSEIEFLLFKDSVVKILDDEDVKTYIWQAIADSGLVPTDTHYEFLLKFARENGINMEIGARNVGAKKDMPMKQNAVMLEATSLTEPIQDVEFDEPTAIIKINRKYREGMSDAEILKAVSGWWRLRMDVAEKVRLVLAVANGCVVGVYRVEKWIPAELPEEAGRIGFVGKTADVATSKRFKDRSAKELFSRGAANPVRYFNVK